MPDVRESRAAHSGIELRASETGDGYTLSGYASLYETPYDVSDFLGTYTETIRTGAFTRALQRGDDCRLLLNHEGVPLARTKSGTLKLTDDPIGLLCEARLDPASPLVASIKSAMDRGDLDQMSFAFQANRQTWNADYTTRDITDVTLFDVSVVTYPASPTTSVGLRSTEAAAGDPRAAAVFAGAAESIRSGATLDPAVRDLLLQVLGAIDAGTAVIDDATEALEAVLGVTPADDAEIGECDCCDAGCTCGDCGACPAAPVSTNSGRLMLALRAAALDL